MKRIRGRPKLKASEETLLRSYSITEREYAQLKDWCRTRGFKVSEIIRVGLNQLKEEGSLEKLLQNREWRNLAIFLINN